MLEIETIELRNVSHGYGDSSNAINKLNLKVTAGELICVLGPSGCGKSTILKILAGQLKPNKGEIFCNGQSLYENLKEIRSHICYAPEEESFDSLLSVRENINFATSIRRPDFSKEECKNKTQNLLEELLLIEKDKVVPGDHFHKLLSGGERKRLNVGLELTSNAPLLLIDEPTTGLSSYDSENIVNCIKKRSDSKICFVSIHQPSRKLFKSFDKALLIDAKGRLAFFGTPDEMENSFKKHLQDCIDESLQKQPSELLQIQSLDSPEFILELLQINFDKKNEYKLSEIEKTYNPDEPSDDKSNKPQSSAVFTAKKRSHKQLTTHFWRALLTKVRNKSGLFSGLLISPILAFFVAGVLRYSETQNYTFSDAPHIPAYIFISLVVAMFLGLTNSAGEIMRDKRILSRERGHGIILTHYILSKFIVLSFIAIAQSWIYVWIGNSILEIHHMHWYYILWIVMTNLVGASIGLLISAISKSHITALSLIPVVIIPQILLAGALIEYNQINPLIYLKKDHSTHSLSNKVPEFCNLIPLRWSYESLIISQNKHNLLNKTLTSIEKTKTNLLNKKELSESEKNKLSQHKEAYTLLFGIKAKDSNEMTKLIEKINTSLKGNTFNDQDYLVDGDLSSTELFLNNKVNDLITAAEIEIEDYRNYSNKDDSKPNVFLAKEKTFVGRDINTINFNFWVLSLFIIISMILTGTVLRKKINSYSGQFI